MDRWRSYLRDSGESIWSFINEALDIARADYPVEFRSRRDGITERIYAPLSALASNIKTSDEDDDLLRKPRPKPKGSERAVAFPTSGSCGRRGVNEVKGRVGHEEEEDEEEEEAELQRQHRHQQRLEVHVDDEEEEEVEREGDVEVEVEEEDDDEEMAAARDGDGSAEVEREEEVDEEEEANEEPIEIDDDESDDDEEYKRRRRARASAAPDPELVLEDTFDADMEALNDAMEREKLLLNDIDSIKRSIKDVNQPEDEVLDLLYRIRQLNISVDALKATNIGRSVNVYRKHASKNVRLQTKQIVSSWKSLVDEWIKNNTVPATAVHDFSVPIRDDGVGLPSPPLDEGGLFASRTVEMTDIFNFTDDDLSAGSGRSPQTPEARLQLGGSVGTEAPLRDYRSSSSGNTNHQRSRTQSSSPDQVVQDARGSGSSKGVARVVKVDKHRPISLEGTGAANNKMTEQDPPHSSGAAFPSGANIRKGVAVTSWTRPTAAAARMNDNTDSRRPAAATVTASVSVQLQKESKTQGIVRNSDARAAASNIGSGPRADQTIRPGLATKSSTTHISVVTETEQRLEASKRRLHSNYMQHELAKKSRTVQPLELTELPKGGPKAQRPGQQRGWARK